MNKEEFISHLVKISEEREENVFADRWVSQSKDSDYWMLDFPFKDCTNDTCEIMDNSVKIFHCRSTLDPVVVSLVSFEEFIEFHIP